MLLKRTGLKINVNASQFKLQRKNARGKHTTAELCFLEAYILELKSLI